MTKLFAIILSAATLLIFSAPALSHPGRTASDGCHYCRTNCEKWGVTRGARHCHNGNHIEGSLGNSHDHDVSDFSDQPFYLRTRVHEELKLVGPLERGEAKAANSL